MLIKKTVIGALISVGVVSAQMLSMVPATAATATQFAAPIGLKTTGQTVSAVALTWDAVSGAPQYRVQVSKSPDMSNAGYVRSDGPKTSVDMRGLDTDTQYYFKVRVIDTAGNNLSAYSPAIAVKTSPARAVLPPVAYPLSVASFNIKCANCSSGDEASWTDRKEAVVSTIKNSQADIVGLQEASQG